MSGKQKPGPGRSANAPCKSSSVDSVNAGRDGEGPQCSPSCFLQPCELPGVACGFEVQVVCMGTNHIILNKHQNEICIYFITTGTPRTV